MKTLASLAVVLTLVPMAALAAPAVGDVVGTEPEAATAALAALGCAVQGFEAEDGLIEAICKDEAGAMSDVYIDPATGAIAKIEAEGE